MDKRIFDQGRTPYYVEDVNSDRIIPKTITVNYIIKRGYVNTEENIKKPIAEDDITMKIKNKLKRYTHRASLRGNTLAKLQEKLNELEEWIDDVDNVTSKGSIKTIYDLLKLFQDMSVDEGTFKEQLNKRVDREDGMVLSEVNFTEELEDKLVNLDDFANNYTHPKEKVCNFKSPVYSVNDKYGDVILTKDDIGMKNFNLNANAYRHPDQKVCSTDSVVSVNGKRGVVNISLEDLGLNKLKDAKILENEDLPSEFDNYITPLALKNYLKTIKQSLKVYLNNRYNNKNFKIKVLAGTILESTHTIKTGDFISTASIELIYKEGKISNTGEIDLSLPYGTYLLKVRANKFFAKNIPLVVDNKISNGDVINIYLDEYYEEYDLNIPDTTGYVNVISTKEGSNLIQKTE